MTKTLHFWLSQLSALVLLALQTAGVIDIPYWVIFLPQGIFVITQLIIGGLIFIILIGLPKPIRDAIVEHVNK